MRLLVFFSISIAIILSTQCNNQIEVIPKEYPFVITNDPVVNASGAIFSGILVDPGKQEILDHGFVWFDEYTEPSRDHFLKAFDLGPKAKTFQHETNSGLEENVRYVVRAYVRTAEQEVYGNPVEFQSLGSLPPEILDFEPKFGGQNTQIEIIGKNFAAAKLKNNVYLATNRFTRLTVVEYSEDRLLVTIPEVETTGKGHLVVFTAGMRAASSEKFELQ